MTIHDEPAEGINGQIPIEACTNARLLHHHLKSTGPGRQSAVFVCVEPHECAKINLVEMLFLYAGATFRNTGEHLITTLAIQEPTHVEAVAGPDPHPQVVLHINEGETYSHDGCLSVTACAGCFTDLWEPLLDREHGYLSWHYTKDGHETLVVPFLLHDHDGAVSVLSDALHRMT